MPIRNPTYLDQDLLQNIAEFLGIEYPVERKVRELGTRERSGAGSVGLPGTVLGARGERSTSDEVETTYEAPVRPVKVLNDVLDEAISSGDIKQIGTNGPATIVRRDLVEIEGVANLSATSEAGGVMEKLLPAFAQSPGGLGGGDVPPGLITAILSDESTPRPLLFDFTSPELSDVRICVQLDRGWFHRNATPDDIDGEVTVVGSVDQLIPEGGEMSLERFLMPGANRAARRMMGKEALHDLMTKLGLEGSTLTLEGPAWVVRPLAVF